ncbi:MAG: DUF5058 domain-containing protein [Spirochaetae bacterium HGW-Spirochaetae-3]|jgi:hypothetical protein|nr:MAG: DUF5058 domain-containing protein [Spirochaetae bacterium HGW-Spirochaetae-3]
MTDIRNSTFLFAIGAFVALFVTAQSLTFMVRAWKEGRRIGLTSATMKKAIIGSASFSFVPSIAILLAVLTLAGALGLPLPWIRLSVVGAITYELPAAETAAQAFGTSIKNVISDPTVFSAIAWAMSVGSVFAMILIILFAKSIQSGIHKARLKDTKWSGLLISAMFMGLISAFLGSALGGGLVSILTLLASAATMGFFGLLIKKAKLAWLENFAMPVSMISGMAVAAVFTLASSGGSL